MNIFPKAKSGMTIGMVFVFLVAVITFAVIMLFGYKAITDFMDKGETVEYYQFKTDLETSVKKIYTEYGSVRVERFIVPVRYEQVCFVDLTKTAPEPCNFDLVACNLWKEAAGNYAGADENVFLYPLPPEGSSPIKVFNIDVGTQGYLCLNTTQGTFKLRMEGKGDRTLLSLPPKT
ncbi:MAG: hypothetical protein ABIA37_04075 [Candidatus Woesearchaeota archaeon]